MNWTIDFTMEFSRGAKVLKKRYKSFMNDLEDFKDSIMKNPFQGAELVPGIRKVSKSDADTVDVKVVQHKLCLAILQSLRLPRVTTREPSRL